MNIRQAGCWTCVNQTYCRHGGLWRGGRVACLVVPGICFGVGTMSTTTVFLDKLLGLYLIAISVAMLARKQRMLETLDQIVRSGPWTLFSGMAATAAGLAIVLTHTIWTGGSLAIAVTLIGWVALLKGLALLLVPPDAMARAYEFMGFERHFQLWMGAVLILGLWMTFEAFFA